MNEFFVPHISESSTYDRISGYFSASSLVGAAVGFNKFIKNKNPQYRLIVGAKLIEDEKEVLWSYEKASDKDRVNAWIDSEIEKIREDASDMPPLQKDRLGNFSYLLDKGILKMKVGIRIDSSGQPIPHNIAEFHEKVGILSDGKDSVSFIGGVNESFRGWSKNQDSIDVYCDWKGEDPKERVEAHKKDFQAYWEQKKGDKSLGVIIHDLPSDAAKKIIDTFPPLEPKYADYWFESEDNGLGDEKSKKINWYDHQIEATDWFCDKDQANGIGIFEMATGSGKTWTSMKCMEQLVSEKRIDDFVVTVPNTLMVQWKEELEEFLKREKDGGIISNFYEFTSKKKEFIQYKRSNRLGKIILVPHSMLGRFLKKCNQIDDEKLKRTFLIVDELHNIGTDSFRNILRDAELERLRYEKNEDFDLDDVSIDITSKDEDLISKFGFRLGLSATPWSHYDEENQRNSFLLRCFTRKKDISETFFNSNHEWQKSLQMGEQRFVYGFGLKDGIEKGILAELDYVPLYYEPSKEEIEEYNELIDSFGYKDENGKIQPLGVIRASSVFKNSKEKIKLFIQELDSGKFSQNKLDRTLIFVETTEFGIQLNSELLKLGFENMNTYFMGAKEIVLKKFAKGDTDFLISCHRLSEGVDIKAVDQIILFSSNGSPLETIQRIGRSLRKESRDVDKCSTVIDFIYQKHFPDLIRETQLLELSEVREVKNNG
jgi:superfamily II DNA or RNA helicase